MIVKGIFHHSDGSKTVDGLSPWRANIQHQVGDILTCGNRQWKVVAVSYWRQGCFGEPINRFHTLKLEPIGHSDLPNEGDELVKDNDNG